jgi:hypothetical protein
MKGVVIRIFFIDTIPFCIIHLNPDSRRILSLLSNAYIKRMRIGIGTSVELSPDLTYILKVIADETEFNVVIHSIIFQKWFLFRGYLQPLLGYHICRLLFLAGYETLSSIVYEQDDLRLLSIHGIGPARLKKIKLKVAKIAP